MHLEHRRQRIYSLRSVKLYANTFIDIYLRELACVCMRMCVVCVCVSVSVCVCLCYVCVCVCGRVRTLVSQVLCEKEQERIQCSESYSYHVACNLESVSRRI